MLTSSNFNSFKSLLKAFSLTSVVARVISLPAWKSIPRFIPLKANITTDASITTKLKAAKNLLRPR